MSNMIGSIIAANTENMATIDRLYLLVAFVLVLPLSSLAQEGKLSGIVRGGSPLDRRVLVGASVHWSGTVLGTQTDVDGRFSIERTSASNSLVVSYTGYVSDTISKPEDGIEIFLKEGVELQGVEVVERKETTSRFLLDPKDVQQLDGRELRKAACCNLSESFETNASIDASFTDAVSGTRQIRMLGLSGRYSHILKDNIPEIRGLSTIYGLGYIPGDWIQDIYISKGAGSVTSGFESMTGEINVALKDARSEERFHLNLYGNQGGRMELNSNANWKINPTWSTILLVHGEWNDSRMDRNGDDFLDNPLVQDVVLRNQWMFQGKEHWEGQYSIDYLQQNRVSGQMDFEPGEGGDELWGMDLDAERMKFTAKTGYVLDDIWPSSFGSQFSAERYELDIQAGLRNWSGIQETFRGNVLFNTKLGCAKKDLTVGVTGIVEDYVQSLDTLSLDRSERVFGAYGEFTWNPSDEFSTIIGVRVDEHNLFNTMFTPRLHMRYRLLENLTVKAAGGRGYRTFNPVTDMVGLLASSREWNIETPIFQESAWNFGGSILYAFELDYRDASLSVDAYTTRFTDRAIVDFETPSVVDIYAMDGESFSNSAQAEFSWEMMRRLDFRLAYRYTDAQNDYRIRRLRDPFNPRHRGFINLSFESKKKDKGAQWKVDGTLQYIGEQRVPAQFEDDLGGIRPSSAADGFLQAHGQVTRVFKRGLEVYLGMENATDYRQDNPIRSAETPFSEAFDASQVWAPIFGRMAYAGLRWTLF